MVIKVVKMILLRSYFYIALIASGKQWNSYIYRLEFAKTYLKF